MEKINDAANNTVKVRLNVEVNFIGYSSFQKSTLNLHIKRVPKINHYYYGSQYVKSSRDQNLITLSEWVLNWPALTVKRIKQMAKQVDCLLNFNMRWIYVVLHEVLVSLKEKRQVWQEISYYLPFIHILMLYVSTWNAVWSVLYLGSYLMPLSMAAYNTSRCMVIKILCYETSNFK